LLLAWGGALLSSIIIVLWLEGLEGIIVDVLWGARVSSSGGGKEVLGSKLRCDVRGRGIMKPDSRFVNLEEIFDQRDEINALRGNKVDVQFSPIPIRQILESERD
jgi:hypothetical protein